MALPKLHTEFRLPKITYLEFKRLEMERALINFFMRLYNDGYTSRLARQSRRSELTIKDFVDQICERPQQFVDFADHRTIVDRWVETHLVDVVNRGKPNQAVAAPRPLHGFTYRMRNATRTRDFGAAQHLYETLYNTRSDVGRDALARLKQFFFEGYDTVTATVDPALFTDVETQAILNLMATVQDAPDQKTRESYPPLCNLGAELMAEDILRLLAYRDYMPRTVMVDYLKILFSFHLFIYHLRLFKLLPVLVQQKGKNSPCAICHSSATRPDNCPFQAKMFADVAADHRSHCAHLAEISTDLYLRRIPGFIKAHYIVRKLDEFADELTKRRKLPRPSARDYSVADLLTLLQPKHENEREIFFGQRLQRLQEDMDSEGAQTPEIIDILGLGLSEFDTYIELLVTLRGDYHRRYMMESLDAMSLKGRPGALMAQPHSRAQRRFILDSRLLEVLLQIAVLKPGGPQGYHTEEIRIDDLLHFLRTRYGLYIDRLPVGEGFDEPSITDQEALRANRIAFINRLREIGFYRDLSDAYVTQTVTPRYPISRQAQPAAALR